MRGLREMFVCLRIKKLVPCREELNMRQAVENIFTMTDYGDMLPGCECPAKLNMSATSGVG